MDARPFGKFFDDTDDLYNWANDALFCGMGAHALCQSGVLEELQKGPAKIADLAQASGIPADKLGRLLDFFVGHEVIDMREDGTLVATARTKKLNDAASLWMTGETTKEAGSRLLDALKQGDVTPFELRFGKPVFSYFSEHPEKAAKFGDFMTFMTRRDMRFIFANHRFEEFNTVADIGGSMGVLLQGMLEEYPGTQGILFDLPDVMEIARPQVEASPLADRIEIVGGSFFENVPSADLYTLKQILHDWHDDECEQILGSIRSAINPGGRLAVIDHVLSDKPAPDEAQSTDVAMMVWDTGRERKRADFERLLAATGFKLDRLTRNPNGHSVIEAVPV